MPKPTDPIVRTIQNQFALNRLGNGLDARTRARMQRLFDRIAAAITAADPSAARNLTARRAKVEALVQELRALIGPAIDEWRQELRAELAKIGSQQALWARSTMLDSVGGPTALSAVGVRLSDPTGLGVNFFKSIIDTNPFEGQILKEWAETQTMRTLVDVRRQIQLGLAQNEAVGDIVRRVRGRRAKGGFAGGVLDATTRQTQSIVRTAINDIATVAHLETYRRETEITQTYTYVATLDGRTTIICASLDGQVFRYDDASAPRPPMHWGCRSTIVPNVNWEGLGLPAPPEGVRATKGGGKVKESTDYEQWLRSKTPAEQDNVLGPSRGKLFRDGLSLRDMVRNDREVLTVEELQGAA